MRPWLEIRYVLYGLRLPQIYSSGYQGKYYGDVNLKKQVFQYGQKKRVEKYMLEKELFIYLYRLFFIFFVFISW